MLSLLKAISPKYTSVTHFSVLDCQELKDTSRPVGESPVQFLRLGAILVSSAKPPCTILRYTLLKLMRKLPRGTDIPLGHGHDPVRGSQSALMLGRGHLSETKLGVGVQLPHALWPSCYVRRRPGHLAILGQTQATGQDRCVIE